MAKHGYKLFEDHKADCFKNMFPDFGKLMAKVYDKWSMQNKSDRWNNVY